MTDDVIEIPRATVEKWIDHAGKLQEFLRKFREGKAKVVEPCAIKP